MRNTNKKGFTIVELVIVVAVIAILAAVLIPTFSSIIKKANQSADQQAVTNMNKLLATEAKAEDVDGVIEILIKNSYAGDLTTYFAGYSLAWVKSENTIVLVEGDAIVYPANLAGKELAYEVIKPMATDGEALAGGLEDGKTVYVGGDVTVDGLAPEAAGTYEVNLAGNTLNSNSYVGSWVDGGKLVVSNGIIDATASENRTIVLAEYSGIVELNNVQIYASSGVNPIQCYGGTMVLNNATTAQYGDNEKGYYNSAIQVVNGYGENANQKAHLTVNGGVYTGKKAIQMSSPGGTIIINDGIFTGSEYAINLDGGVGSGYVEIEHSLTINGGTFNGDIRINNTSLEGFTVVINGGTFNGNIIDRNGNVLDVAQFLGEGKTVVNNADGTWTVK